MKNWKKYRNLLFTLGMFLFMAVGIFGEYKTKREKVTQLVYPDGEEKLAETEIKREWKEEEDLKPRVALTFDDGPHSVYTAVLLEGLRERDVVATFFLIGKNISGNEELIQQMEADGHLIGNHTYDHVRLTGLSEEEACRQLMKTSDLIKEITGKDTEYVRPPFGEWNQNIECGITMFPIMWQVDPLDWTTSNVEQVVHKVISKTGEDDIILLHDIFDSSVEAALRIVDILKEEGYEFVTVDQLILE